MVDQLVIGTGSFKQESAPQVRRTVERWTEQAHGPRPKVKASPESLAMAGIGLELVEKQPTANG